MSKTISWPAKVTYIVIALALALSMAMVALPKAQVGADPGTTKWSKVSTPQINYSDWKIRQDSTINSFDMGPDSATIYAVGSVDSTHARPYLWKSTDSGATWSDKTAAIQKDWVTSAYITIKAEGLPAIFTEFDLVSVAPEDSDFVAVAGYGSGPMVVFSDDGGAKFHYLSAIGTASKIYSMDVSTDVSDNHFVMVGTDIGVFITEVPGYGGWQNASAKLGWLAAQDAVTSVAFSPIFDDDETLLAISTNGTATWLQSGRWGTTKAWNAAAGTPFPAAVKIVADTADYTNYPFTCTGIALPSDYDGFSGSLRKVFVYVDTDHGYLYRIDSSKIFICPGRDYGFGPDVDGDDLFASLAYYGTGIDGKFMLGALPTSATTCCTGVQVWRAEEIDFCCPEWNTASKKPSGQLTALVAFTPDGKKGYAATQGDGSGDESAFSVSLDGNGKYWNQLSLIDTEIDYLSDVAVSGDCNTTLLFTVNNSLGCYCDSVWFKAADLPEATEYDDVWIREWHGHLTSSGTNPTDMSEIGLIRLAPEETARVFTVYLVDRGQNIVLYNDSSGLTNWLDRHCTRITEITDLAAESNSIIYALGDGDMVSKSTNNGKKWATEVDTKVGAGHTIAALADGNVLVGPADDTHKVAYSSDGAATFARTAALASDTGNIHVAFDTYFDVNDTIYAAADGNAGGIYRWVIDESDDWTDLKAEPTLAQMGGSGTTKLDVSYYGIVTELSGSGNPLTDATRGGVLYAAYLYNAGVSEMYTGVARCLTPAETACCSGESWDYLHAKLTVGKDHLLSQEFALEPSSLRLCGCLSPSTNTNLWAIDYESYLYDDGNGRLWTYEDCFAKEAPPLTAVADGKSLLSDPCYCYNNKFTLEWDRLCNACEYDIQISLDKGFTEIVRDTDYFTTTAGYSGRLGDGGFYKPSSGASPSLVVNNGVLNCSTTYYWRVRSRFSETNEAIQSFWSDVRSFSIGAGPAAAIDLTTPDDGATNVALEGVVFTWTAVAEATGYDFTLMDASGTSVDSKTGLTSTAYACPEKLSYNTPYTWKVTAMKGGSVLSESPLSTFRTVPPTAPAPTPPAPIPPPPPPTTPAWVWVVIGIGAVLVITVIVLIFRTRRV